LIGTGPVRIRLTEFGRARREKVADLLRQAAKDSLKIDLEIAMADAVANEELAAAALPAGSAAHSSAESSALESAKDSAAEDGAGGDEPAATETVPALAPHDLVVTWRGMHWDAAKMSAFRDLAGKLRLPV